MGSGLGGEGPGLRPREHHVVPITVVVPPFKEDGDWSRGQGAAGCVVSGGGL